jgi:imidazolonepropionase-like amidohydrolase
MRGYRADLAFDGERVIPGGALVLVEDEVIVAVEAGSAPAPADCPVAYEPGTTLLPGLIDTHVHLCGDNGPRALDQLPELSQDQLNQIISDAFAQHLRAGVTAVRDLGDRDWAVVERRDTVAGQPHVVASGPPITSIDGHCWNMGGATSGFDGLRQAVRERAERGVDIVKIMTSGGLLTEGTDVGLPQFTLDELRLVVDEAHRLGLAVTGHAHALTAVEQCVEVGIDGIEHCTCFTRSGLHTPAELIDRIAAAGIRVCPTLGLTPGAEPPPRIKAIMEASGLTWQLRFEQVAKLHRAGVALISGGDSGIGPGKPHGLLPQAVIDLAGAEVPLADALASATSRAADACGLADRTGRLRAGLAADLLLVGGNPMIDIEALRSVRTVVARGQEIDLS